LIVFMSRDFDPPGRQFTNICSRQWWWGQSRGPWLRLKPCHYHLLHSRRRQTTFALWIYCALTTR
jgi:hypothetical protein